MVRLGLCEKEAKCLKSSWDELSGNELFENELSGDQLSGDELSGDELSGDELFGDELSWECVDFSEQFGPSFWGTDARRLVVSELVDVDPSKGVLILISHLLCSQGHQHPDRRPVHEHDIIG